MAKYQDPNFDKKQYWKMRDEGTPATRRLQRVFAGGRYVVGVLSNPGQSNKPVTKKAILKNSKRARRGGTFTGGVSS